MRILILSLLLTTALFAQKLEKEYDISYGVFSALGKAKASLYINKETKEYEATIEAKATGLAKFLSNGKYERYISKGKIEGNIFVPQTFYKLSATNSKKREKFYTFDYNKELIFLKYIQSKKDKEIVEEEILPFFTDNDLLSLFFNLKDILLDLEVDKEFNFVAIGNDKNNGIISVKKLDKRNLKVYLNQKIFSSKRGELEVELENDGLCKMALLKDVLLFGDIVAK